MTNFITSFFALHTAEEVFSTALWLAGIGHFCVLIASFQVPSRLGWKVDLQKLTSFNRKLMWVHGGFAVLTILAFGTLTLALHAEMLRGDRAALGLALFIVAVYAVMGLGYGTVDIALMVLLAAAGCGTSSVAPGTVPALT